ncbi:hypothetical protein SI65_05598 [Aspergillus cristatus]|uniref:Beta-lactamase-related domain-containing protein n=1 Tax=Aspergillus cristatus TaxID=573508 RepID=A0A1E3BDZ4_ASPCR|nr:hypothetical protein SI65_05598 [Aspergillus cristatus]
MLLGIYFFGALALANALSGQDNSYNGRNGLGNDTTTRLNQAFETAVSEKRVPGIAAAAFNRDGSIIFKQSWGTTSIEDPSSPPINSSTKMWVASMTKAVTASAALQLVEQGKLSLDDPVWEYLPELEGFQVLEGFTDAGGPIYRAPRTQLTIRHLMTHTSGLRYTFLDANTERWMQWRRNVTFTSTRKTRADSQAPFGFDAGDGYAYGYNIDWLGWVVEAITGVPLARYCEEHILKPLGMQNTGIYPPDIADHQRLANGTITATPYSTSPTKPGDFVDAGGDYLTSTLDDYSTFLLALINEGSDPRTGVSILRPETVRKYIFTDQIPLAIPGYRSPGFEPEGDPIGTFNSVDPSVSNNGTLLSGIQKGWSSAFMVNNEDVPGGRRKGSGAWAGINNLYYWVDPTAGKLGVAFTSLSPFLDQEVLGLFDTLEKEVYAL